MNTTLLLTKTRTAVYRQQKYFVFIKTLESAPRNLYVQYKMYYK